MSEYLRTRADQDRAAAVALARRRAAREHRPPVLARTPCPRHGEAPCNPSRRACRPSERYCDARREALTDAGTARREAIREAGRRAGEEFDQMINNEREAS